MKISHGENTGTGNSAHSYSKFCIRAKSAARLKLGVKALNRAFAGITPAVWRNFCLLVFIVLSPLVMVTNTSRRLSWLWMHKSLNEHIQWPRFICSHLLLINGCVLATVSQTCTLMKLLLPKIQWQRARVMPGVDLWALHHWTFSMNDFLLFRRTTFLFSHLHACCLGMCLGFLITLQGSSFTAPKLIKKSTQWWGEEYGSDPQMV